MAPAAALREARRAIGLFLSLLDASTRFLRRETQRLARKQQPPPEPKPPAPPEPEDRRRERED